MSTDVAAHAVDQLRVEIVATREQLGELAANAIARRLRTALRTQDRVRVLFAAAPSQASTLAALATEPNLDWSRVDAFHMDEYVGIAPDAPQRFGRWLCDAIFERVRPGSVHLIDPAADPDAEARRYGDLLADAPLDVVLAGVGVTGHLAFNDPPVDFAEPGSMKVVTLDERSRQQQVDEGLFPRLDDVPTRALTVTMSRLLSGRTIFCMVSGALKRPAVARALSGEVAPDSPASALRQHRDATLFLDAAADPHG